MKTLALVAALVLAVALALALHVRTTDQPYCPTEDSCTIDYRDGTWTVTEVTP